MVYTPAVLIIAAAALNVASTAAIPIDTENALAAREEEPLFVREEPFSGDLVTREPEPFLPLIGMIARVGAQVGARVGSKAAQHAVKHKVEENHKKNKRSDEFELEAREPEPEPEPFFGGIKKFGAKMMNKFRGKGGRGRKQQGPPQPDQGADGSGEGMQRRSEFEERDLDDGFELEARDFDDDFELEAREFDDFELEAREPEPGAGSLISAGSKLLGKAFKHRHGIKKGAQIGSDIAQQQQQQQQRRSEDFDFELEAREFDDFELEAREPEPAGAGSLISAGSKLLGKAFKHRHGIKKGVEIGSDIAQQQQQRRSEDFDFELEARDFDDFELETREPEPGAGSLISAGSKLLGKAFKHRHGIKKGVEIGSDIAQQQQQRRSMEYELEELD